MRESIKNSISETIQDLMNAGLTTSFTDNELKTLGENRHKVKVTAGVFKKENKSTGNKPMKLTVLWHGMCSTLRCKSNANPSLRYGTSQQIIGMLAVVWNCTSEQFMLIIVHMYKV